MFLNNIKMNFTSRIAKSEFLKNNNVLNFCSATPDTFEKSSQRQNYEIAYDAAKSKIISYLDGENPIEYGISIDKNGTILEEDAGDEHSCTSDIRKIIPGTAMLHGHPAPLPLSSGDIASLLASDASEIVAFTKDGKFSSLRKNNETLNTSESYPSIYPALEKKLCKKCLDKMGIDYSIKKEDVANLARGYLEYETGKDTKDKSDDEVFKELMTFGFCYHSQNPEYMMAELRTLMDFYFLMNPAKREECDKAHKLIMENYSEIQELFNSEEGPQIRHEFLKDVAKEYHLSYTTDLFED